MIGHSAAESGFIPVRDIPGLIALLDRSEVGTFVLDEIVSDALCKSKFRTCIAGLPDEQGGLWMYEFDGHAPSSALRVTQSLDAALALAERVLAEQAIGGRPGRLHDFAQHFNGRWEAKTYRVSDGSSHQSVAATPALALCIAIIKAKAQGEGG